MNQQSETVLLTRQRWNAYLLALFLGALLIAILNVWLTGRFQFLFAPVVVAIPLWLILRMQTPREGLRALRLQSRPGLRVLIWFEFAALALAILLLVLDSYVFGHPITAPLKPYHAVLHAPPFIIMFIGVYLSGRIAKSNQVNDSADDEKDQSE